MINEIKKLVLEVDVKKLSIEDLYYYVLLLCELGLDDYTPNDIITSEDYD